MGGESMAHSIPDTPTQTALASSFGGWHAFAALSVLRAGPGQSGGESMAHSRLREHGWTGDDLSEFVLKEMDSLLMDEPRLSADHLAARGKTLSVSAVEES